MTLCTTIVASPRCRLRRTPAAREKFRTVSLFCLVDWFYLLSVLVVPGRGPPMAASHLLEDINHVICDVIPVTNLIPIAYREKCGLSHYNGDAFLFVLII